MARKSRQDGGKNRKPQLEERAVMEQKGALNGITVIDFTSMMSGPFATRILTDCGANVIKIELAEGTICAIGPLCAIVAVRTTGR